MRNNLLHLQEGIHQKHILHCKACGGKKIIYLQKILQQPNGTQVAAEQQKLRE